MPFGYDLQRVRDDIPAAKSCYYLNTGTLGPSPRRVTDAFVKAYRQWEATYPGQPGQYRHMHDLNEVARPLVADLIGADPDEIALTGNSSDGINIVAHGLGFRTGDEVIISDQEHPAVFVPWLHLAQRGKVKVRVLKLDNDPGKTMANLREILGPQTVAVCVSHVSSMTGLILPVKEICELAHQVGAAVCLDGAQATGQLPLDVREIGCDFYALNGHKWLLGPVGTGALYVRHEAFDRLVPYASGGGSVLSYGYPASDRLDWRQDARKFEFGTRNWALVAGWAESLKYIGELGVDSIRRHQLDLGAGLCRRIARLPGVDIISPEDTRLRTGLVSFRLAGWDASELCARLWDEGRIATRPVRELNALRVSVAFFTSDEDLDALMCWLEKICGGPRTVTDGR